MAKKKRKSTYKLSDYIYPECNMLHIKALNKNKEVCEYRIKGNIKTNILIEKPCIQYYTLRWKW